MVDYNYWAVRVAHSACADSKRHYIMMYGELHIRWLRYK